MSYNGEDLPNFEDFHDWQKDAFKLLLDKTNVNRKMFWIYETRNESYEIHQFTKYMAFHHRTSLIYAENYKHDSIMNIAYKIRNNLETLIVYVPRFIGNKVSYDAIYNIKDGLIFKKNICMIPRKPVNVMVFAHEYPDTSNLSNWKWNIYEIVDRELVRRDLPSENN